jgi:hypothetical protein
MGLLSESTTCILMLVGRRTACTALLPLVAPAEEFNCAVVLKPRTIVRNPDLYARARRCRCHKFRAQVFQFGWPVEIHPIRYDRERAHIWMEDGVDNIIQQQQVFPLFNYCCTFLFIFDYLSHLKY